MTGNPSSRNEEEDVRLWILVEIESIHTMRCLVGPFLLLAVAVYVVNALVSLATLSGFMEYTRAMASAWDSLLIWCMMGQVCYGLAVMTLQKRAKRLRIYLDASF